MSLDIFVVHQPLADMSRLQSRQEMMINLIMSNLYTMTDGRNLTRRGEC